MARFLLVAFKNLAICIVSSITVALHARMSFVSLLVISFEFSANKIPSAVHDTIMLIHLAITPFDTLISSYFLTCGFSTAVAVSLSAGVSWSLFLSTLASFCSFESAKFFKVDFKLLRSGFDGIPIGFRSFEELPSFALEIHF